ncbi:MAG: heme-binding domain-containing protein [Bdellovibrionales bacterium]|nr:heme-binding domain-containing protein [Bdellovibrionales bacterium]
MKSFTKLVFTLYLIFLCIAAAGHNGKNHAEVNIEEPKESFEKKNLKSINQEYVLKVKPIFESKCFDCHGINTEKPWYYVFPGIKQMINHDISEAKEHMDMVNDFPFGGHGSPREDLEALKETVENESMPPLQYKIMHWNSLLTKEEKKIISEWIGEGLKKLPNG